MRAMVYGDTGVTVGDARVGGSVGRNGEVREVGGGDCGGADLLMEVFERFVGTASGGLRRRGNWRGGCLGH